MTTTTGTTKTTKTTKTKNTAETKKTVTVTTAPTATATATAKATARATTPASSPAPQELVRFLEDRFACAEASADCARACVLRASALDPEGTERLRLLRRKAILCAEVCDATCRVLAEDTRVDEAGLRVQLEWCRTICLETAHAFGDQWKRPSPPGAAETAEACRACARACTDFMATLH